METEIPHMENEPAPPDLDERIQDIELKIENLKPESIWGKLKNLIKGYIVAIGLFGLAWYFVGYWAIIIAIIIIPSVFFYTKYIYQPPAIPILLVGHKDPENTNSMIIVDAYGIPNQLANELDFSGVATPVTTPWGVGYLAEAIKKDEKGNVTGIVFAWPHNNELNFMTKHSLFHYLRQENYILAKAFNEIKMLLHSKAVRMAFEYATYIIKFTGDEKIAHGLKGKEDETTITKDIEQYDLELRKLREKYKMKNDMADTEEAELVPEG